MRIRQALDLDQRNQEVSFNRNRLNKGKGNERGVVKY